MLLYCRFIVVGNEFVLERQCFLYKRDVVQRIPRRVILQNRSVHTQLVNLKFPTNMLTEIFYSLNLDV